LRQETQVNISKDDATRALAEITAAGASSARWQHYRRFAPYLIMWGSIWVVANSVTDLHPAAGGLTWLVLSVLGSIGSFWLGASSSRTEARGRGHWRWGLCFALILGFFVANFAILPQLSARQQSAYISLFWAFLYAVTGAWLGLRLLLIGLATVALILVGYFLVDAHFFLYMGVVTGSSLILGGLWLRRI
jgi:hypothetical protein